jgi:GNAT superfamily N-acetyltransferase
VDEQVRALVDSEWQSRLGVDGSVLGSGSVHVVVADLGANDALSILLDHTCIVVVRPDDLDAAQTAFDGLDAQAAFTAEALRKFVGTDAQVDGPSCHSYANERSFRGGADPAAEPVRGDDGSLLTFLERNNLADWAESGFPPDPRVANAETTQFWVFREDDQVVAAGNLTDWRGVPADVGVLTDPSHRRRGLARLLVGAMVADALPTVGVVRYRALVANVASLAIATRLGFEPHGQNFRARRNRADPPHTTRA